MVIFQNRLDITDIVLTELNRNTDPPPQVNKAKTAIGAEGPETKLAQPPRGTKAR